MNRFHGFRPLPPLPNFEVSEEVVMKAADETRICINYALLIAHDIAIVGDLKLFWQVHVIAFADCDATD